MYFIAIRSVSILESLFPEALVSGSPSLSWAKILLQSFILARSRSQAALLYSSLFTAFSNFLTPALLSPPRERRVWFLWMRIFLLLA